MRQKRTTEPTKPYRVLVGSFMGPDQIQYPKESLVELTDKQAKRALELKYIELAEAMTPVQPAPKATPKPNPTKPEAK